MITTHVLDTSRGAPASSVRITLVSKRDGARIEIGRGETDADGRLRTLVPAGTVLPPGIYELTFDVGSYFARRSVACFFPEVSIAFETLPGEAHYHVPLLLSPYGYSTYRGSLPRPPSNERKAHRVEAHVREILDLAIRWVHLIAGILWIGNSMLFNWLDRNLEKPDPPKERLEGTIWLVHSGGFYDIEKKQLAPNEIPPRMHWFKWQNGITWLSGIFLLGVVYYMGHGAYLLDPSVSSIGFGPAIGLGVGSILVSWVLYDLLWRSPLGKNDLVAAPLCFAYLVGVSCLLTHFLSGRAAYIHVGVLLGTLMTANVWMRILPAQTELLAATKAGRAQDASIAWRAKQRSIHNNYMTFPLLFLMVSNHFPSTYGSSINWVILAVLMVTGALVRHFMNIRFWFAQWLPAFSSTIFVGVVAVYWLTAPRSAPPKPAAELSPEEIVHFKTVRGVVTQRCLPCHSANPTDDVWKTAPVGIMFDTPQQMKTLAPRMKDRVVISKTMPLQNKTQITDAERDLIGSWVDQGAPIDN